MWCSKRWCAGLLMGLAVAGTGWLGVTAPAWAQTKNAASSKATEATRHIAWQDLVPPGWNPTEILKQKFNDPSLPMLSDDNPKVQALMEEMRTLWDTAPVNPAMDGVAGRIPGYVVPLEDTRAGMKSFLLVPYYGACIHTPPPPANQIVHVVLAKPLKGYNSMDTVWVYGTLRAVRTGSEMGVSAYRIDALRVSPYERRSAETAR